MTGIITTADGREVTEDTVTWSVEILNKPSGTWAKMMGISMICDTEESASAYAHRLVAKCGVSKARVVQTRTVSTVEEVYPA